MDDANREHQRQSHADRDRATDAQHRPARRVAAAQSRKKSVANKPQIPPSHEGMDPGAGPKRPPQW
jgi:hypothetical protein